MLGFIQDIDEFYEEIISSVDLVTKMQSRGINSRYLGVIAKDSKFNHIRELAVIEILAKSIKNILKDALAQLQEDSLLDDTFTYRKLKDYIVKFLNEVLSIGRQDSQIWEYLTEYIKDRYQVFLTKEVLSKIHMNGVVLSLSDKIGLRINQLREIDFAKFLPFDLANI